MPELPEVETVRRQLARIAEGRGIASVEVFDERLTAPVGGRAFAAALAGARIARVGRRGKYLVVELTDGRVLLLHLRMTGSLSYLPDGDADRATHVRAVLHMDDRAAIAFRDPRRFGTAELLPSQAAAADHFARRLGPEPFSDEFTGARLHGVTRRRTTPIKAVLLDQRQAAGVGNIYADEALFRAGISPRRRGASVTRRQCDALCDAIRESLRAGIDAAGASVGDFRDAYGALGTYQDRFLVHRRAGLPCPSCGTPVEKIRVAGRGTYFCPACQRG